MFLKTEIPVEVGVPFGKLRSCGVIILPTRIYVINFEVLLPEGPMYQNFRFSLFHISRCEISFHTFCSKLNLSMYLLFRVISQKPNQLYLQCRFIGCQNSLCNDRPHPKIVHTIKFQTTSSYRKVAYFGKKALEEIYGNLLCQILPSENSRFWLYATEDL